MKYINPIARRAYLLSLVVVLLAVLSVTTACTTKRETTKKPPKTETNTKPLGDKRLEVHMIDVGQGDSLLIITPEHKTVLIDAGLARAGANVVEALARNKVDHLDLAVATHPHADHIGGMPKVLDAVPVKMFLDSGQDHPTATYERLLTSVKEKVGKLTIARAGQEFSLDSGIKIKVLGPQTPLLEKVSGSVENANSVILYLTYGNFHMLFTGDSEDETEIRLLDAKATLSAQVLKVAHHGSQYASTPEFLDKVHPEVAIISCGADNDYGHPAPKTLNSLQQRNVLVHRTDLEGEIVVTSDGANYQVTTEHAPTGDIWKGRTSAKRKN